VEGDINRRELITRLGASPAVCSADVAFAQQRDRLRSMNIYMGVGMFLSRYESPFLFWLMIAWQCLVLGALFATIYVPIFVLPNQIMS